MKSYQSKEDVMDGSTHHARNHAVVAGGALVAALFATLSCSDPAPSGPVKPEPIASATSSESAPISVVYLTPAQILGIERRLGAATNLEAAVVFASQDARISALANQIASDRIALDDQIDAAAALLGVVPVDTPTSLEVAAESARAVAALRALSGKEQDDAFINGLALRESRALGVADYMLAPNARGSQWLTAVLQKTRTVAMRQLDGALEIQRARNDWRFNTLAPTGDAPPGGQR
jgi:hypothetical protein